MNWRAGRRGLVAFALCCSVLAPALAWAEGAPMHWRVVWTEDPAHEAFVGWTTLGAGTTHQVHLDTVSRDGEALSAYAMTAQAVASAAYLNTEQDAHYHQVSLSGLEPATTYYFVMESDGEVSRELHFTTAPVDERPIKLLYGGDSRSDREDRQLMNRRIAALSGADPEVIALVHGGDYIYDGDNWPQWREWLEDHTLTVSEAGKILPIIPARGNHEADDRIYKQIFAPFGAQHNYTTTRFGAHTRLITLDSNASAGGDQRRFLEEQLIEARDARWILANYHIPAYPAVKIPGPAKIFWVPLFEQYGVDLVLESDGHALKRTVPILKDAPDPAGVVYVGEGGLGVRQREPDARRWYLQSPGMAMSAHHVQIITITPEGLTYEAVLEDGTIADTYTRAPRPERAFTPFELAQVLIVSPERVHVILSHTIDPDHFDTSGVTVDGGLTLENVSLRNNSPDTVVLLTSTMTPGQTYTLTLGDVRDLQGRPLLLSEPLTFTAEGELMEPPVDMPADMPSVPGVDVDMGAPPERPVAEVGGNGCGDDEGCSAAASPARAGAPLLLLVVGFGLGRWRVRRRRDAS